MTVDDYTDVDSIDLTSWQWYVLLGYPAASVLGIVSLGRLAGGSILASSLGTVALLIVMTAFGTITLPAIWHDAAFVRSECDRWQPERQTYVGSAVLAPVILAVLAGFTAGFGVAIALFVVAFLVSTITVCLVYLYNRHRTIGLLTR